MRFRFTIVLLLLGLNASCYSPSADYKAKQEVIKQNSDVMRAFCDTNANFSEDWLVANIYFSNNSATLTSKDIAVLQEIINLHRRCASTMLIIGHSSNQEAEQGIPFATKLSYLRSEAVAQYFLANNIAYKYPQVYFCGNNRNVVLGSLESANQYNQRVEIVFVRTTDMNKYNQQLCVISKNDIER